MNPQMMNPIMRRLLAYKMMQGGGAGGPEMLGGGPEMNDEMIYDENQATPRGGPQPISGMLTQGRRMMPNMDPSMSRMPPMGGPAGGGPDMEMDFPQGDADYEAQAGRLAQPQLVHSMPEMQKQYGGRAPQEAQDMTRMYEQAPQGPIKERLHADQHSMIRRHKGADLSLQRMTLAQKKAQLVERLRMLKESGRTDEMQRILGALQKQGITLDQMLGDEPSAQ